MLAGRWPLSCSSARMDHRELRARIRLLMASGELPPGGSLADKILPGQIVRVTRVVIGRSNVGIVLDLRCGRPAGVLHVCRPKGSPSSRRLRCPLAPGARRRVIRTVALDLRADSFGTILRAPMSMTLVARVIEQCRASHGHLDASGRLLAHSRRLLNRAWWIDRA